MIKTARLNIKGNGTDPEIILAQHMKKLNITMADIEVHYDNQYSNNTHLGNWCLVPVLDNLASSRLAASMGTKLDHFQQILEDSDIANFKAGTHVRVQFVNGLGLGVNTEGKILRSTPAFAGAVAEIVITQKGSRIKGWKFNPGDTVTIEKIQ